MFDAQSSTWSKVRFLSPQTGHSSASDDEAGGEEYHNDHHYSSSSSTGGGGCSSSNNTGAGGGGWTPVISFDQEDDPFERLARSFGPAAPDANSEDACVSLGCSTPIFGSVCNSLQSVR